MSTNSLRVADNPGRIYGRAQTGAARITLEIGMSAEGPYYHEYDPDFRVAVDEERVASINAGYRYKHRTREPRSSRLWTRDFRMLLSLTAVIPVQFMSV